MAPTLDSVCGRCRWWRSMTACRSSNSASMKKDTKQPHQRWVRLRMNMATTTAGSTPTPGWTSATSCTGWTISPPRSARSTRPAPPTTTQRATAYKQELTTLDGEIRTALAGIPPERRKLVTDHDNLSYLAQAYGLEVIGSVIPAISTMAAASAQERAALQRQIQEQGVPAILVDATVNAAVARQLAADTGAQVVTVYTGSLSAADGPAPTYVEMMRHAAEEIVQALK